MRLAFYLNEQVPNYERNGVPAQAHLLVVQNASPLPTQGELRGGTPSAKAMAAEKTIAARTSARLKQLLKGRDYEPLFVYGPQNLTVYRVEAANAPRLPNFQR